MANLQVRNSSLSGIDVREGELAAMSEVVLCPLLRDHSTGRNIFWATHDYESLGKEYDFYAPILPELITGEREGIIKPRVLKTKDNQTGRSKDMAEVFTPSWVCNAQNNLVDEAWFGRKDVFNTTSVDGKSWEANSQNSHKVIKNTPIFPNCLGKRVVLK